MNKIKMMKEGAEKSLKLAKLGKDMIEICPTLVNSMEELVSAASAGDGDEDAGTIRDALADFKEAVTKLRITTEETKRVVNELEVLLGSDEKAKEGKIGKLVVKFLKVIEAAVHLTITCDKIVAIVDDALKNGLNMDVVKDVGKAGIEVKDAIVELKDAITGDDEKEEMDVEEKKDANNQQPLKGNKKGGEGKDEKQKNNAKHEDVDDEVQSAGFWTCGCCRRKR